MKDRNLIIEKGVNSLEKYIIELNYKGYDPYDALKSPLFKIPFFQNTKLIRFLAQQIVKRSPINIRPLLFVPKGMNPVTLGLCIQGYAYLTMVYPSKKDYYEDKILELTDKLRSLVPQGYSGPCWGYDFDWEARYSKIPAYQPTVVATGIIVNGLYQAWKITGMNSLKELVVESSDFVLNDLNRTYEEDSFCFSYSPFDEQRVFNASMKGARLLSQAYAITGKSSYKENAGNAVKYVIKNQNADGSWGYSQAKTGGWIDNYHSGYILDCLHDYIALCDDKTYQKNLEIGFDFYKNNFFNSEGRPKFYSDKIYPIDCTAASQSILTLSRFGENRLANKTAEWIISNMQRNDGGFYFRKFRFYTMKISFMRWSNAWMFASLTYLLKMKMDSDETKN